MKVTKNYREIQSNLLDISNENSINYIKFLQTLIINVYDGILDISKDILKIIHLNIHNVINKLMCLLEEKYNNLLNGKESSSAISLFIKIL